MPDSAVADAAEISVWRMVAKYALATGIPLILGVTAGTQYAGSDQEKVVLMKEQSELLKSIRDELSNLQGVVATSLERDAEWRRSHEDEHRRRRP